MLKQHGRTVRIFSHFPRNFAKFSLPIFSDLRRYTGHHTIKNWLISHNVIKGTPNYWTGKALFRDIMQFFRQQTMIDEAHRIIRLRVPLIIGPRKHNFSISSKIIATCCLPFCARLCAKRGCNVCRQNHRD